ncbi:DUF6512 family protein [Alkaliphilus peptidifermentans]|uniref:Uncharacterized protein n=1 Tax=Alkaliphilus peptidifermentans DSM 18978 TaxID=1120976 RepID=A0A1G5LCC3_9FIRM|nr:DUF6512 family protein [Alkaliphilus peptidifermentans]SCZ10456.1 hypothetical protein SAMN03080606_04287 [Alkaliphilus peptidifermentans DSM 18978]
MSKLYYWELAGLFFIFTVGALFHFAFDWLNRIKALAFLFPVNESPWEHLKMAYWPIIIFAFLEFFFLNISFNHIVVAKAVAAFSVCIAIISLHYSYKAIIGSHIVFVDIIIFFLAIALGQLLSYRILTATAPKPFAVILAYLSISVLGFMFIFFTFNPPDLFLFRASSGKSGINVIVK